MTVRPRGAGQTRRYTGGGGGAAPGRRGGAASGRRSPQGEAWLSDGGTEAERASRRLLPERTDGYAAIRDYAVLGDGRSAVLVAADGQVDWWPLPKLDSPPACGALLDPAAGGHFLLRPAGDCEFSRRYIPGTNVLETFYWTSTGAARVTDSLNSGLAGRLPWVELARRAEAVHGAVELEWEFVPGNRFGTAKPFVTRSDGVPVIKLGDQLLAVLTGGCEEVEACRDKVRGRLRLSEGSKGLVAVLASDDQPLFIERPEHVEARLERTIGSWEQWSELIGDMGPWTEPVVRSALALKTVRSDDDGAIAAAATTSLPEQLQGPKNWDYRFAWIRDTAFTLDAFIELGLHEEVQASVAWMLKTLRRNGRGLKVFYTLDGEEPGRETQLDLPGYRASKPVRVGNSARKQRQLGVYGDLFDMIGRYVDDGHVLDDRSTELLTELADRCADEWQQKDSGIWELPQLEHYTISKIGCWVAMDRAYRLAEVGQLPASHAERWGCERYAIKRWVDENCWSEEQRSYTFFAGSEKLDAAVLLAGRTGFERGERLASTIEAVVRSLGRGPMLYRYSGMEEEEGAFVACSFWLVSALAYNGQAERASALMSEAIKLRNDVGLLSEQVSPVTGEFLGNMPQGLSHLALIQAAHALCPGSVRRGAVG